MQINNFSVSELIKKNSKRNKSISNDVHKVIKEEYHAIKSLLHMSDRQNKIIEEAIEHLSHCRGKIISIGVGKSGIIGRKIAASLSSTGSPAMFVNAAESNHGDLGAIAVGDIVLMVSNSGETEECLRMIPYIKDLGLEIILITSNDKSTLAGKANFVININILKEADEIPAPTNSTTATLVIGDAIAIALMKLKKFTKEDFLKSHPGGNLGKGV